MRGNINPFTSSEFALLGFLYDKPTHGYDLHKSITDPDGIGLIWNVKMSNLYAYLDKLDKKGFIHGTMQPGDAHPTRMEYQITEEGKKPSKSGFPPLLYILEIFGRNSCCATISI